MQELSLGFPTDFDDFSALPARARVSRAIGGKRPPTDFVLHPKGWPLVGFRFCTYPYRGDDIIKCLQPVFRDPQSETEEAGPLIGNLDAGCIVHEVIAKPGYVIGGLKVRWGTRVHGMRIRFNRLDNGRLNLNESYESDWYGGKADMSGQEIGSDDSPIVGIHFAHNVDINCIALVSSDLKHAGQ